jgi:hypothetical protein
VREVAAVRARCGRPPAESDGLRLRLDGGDTIPAGAPLHVSRQQRLVLYRGGDGRWMLGLREWSADVWQMSAPQPIAGPFVRGASAGERSGFRYFDGDGADLWPDRDPAAGAAVRRLRLTLLSMRGATPIEESADIPLPVARAR